jgi:hypothetical protein
MSDFSNTLLVGAASVTCFAAGIAGGSMLTGRWGAVAFAVAIGALVGFWVAMLWIDREAYRREMAEMDRRQAEMQRAHDRWVAAVAEMRRLRTAPPAAAADHETGECGRPQ